MKNHKDFCDSQILFLNVILRQKQPRRLNKGIAGPATSMPVMYANGARGPKETSFYCRVAKGWE